MGQVQEGGQPDYPAALSSLQHMDSEQLKDILNNEDKFDEFIRELPQMKALQEEKEMLLTSNKSLAEYNLSQEPVVGEAKARLQEKYRTAQQLGEEVRELKAALDTKQGNVSPDTLLALLEAANQEVEEESEQMTDRFLSGGDNLDEFLEHYHEKRKIAHLRRVKVDKLKELVRGRNQQQQQGHQGQGTPSRAAPPPPGHQQRAGNYSWGGRGPGYEQLPYPAQPQYNMPMPMPPSYR